MKRHTDSSAATAIGVAVLFAIIGIVGFLAALPA